MAANISEARMSLARQGDGMTDLFRQIRQMFIEHNDKVDLETFREILIDAGLPMQQDSQGAFQEIDINSRGYITFDQFFNLALSYIQQSPETVPSPFSLSQSQDIPMQQAPEQIQISLNNDKIRQLRQLFSQCCYIRYGTRYAKFDKMLAILNLETSKQLKQLNPQDLQSLFHNQMILMNEISEQQYSRIIKQLEIAWLNAQGIQLDQQSHEFDINDNDYASSPKNSQYNSSPGAQSYSSSAGSPNYGRAEKVVDQTSAPLDLLNDLLQNFLDNALWREVSDSYISEIFGDALKYVQIARNQFDTIIEEKQRLHTDLIDSHQKQQSLRLQNNQRENLMAQYEQKLEVISKEHRHVVNKNKGQNQQLKALESQNIQLRKQAVILERVQNQKRTLQWQFEEFKNNLMAQNRKSQLISQISLKYGSSIRQSKIFFQERQSSLNDDDDDDDESKTEDLKNEQQIEAIINSVRQQQVDDLNKKLQDMKKRINQLQEDNQKLLKQKENKFCELIQLKQSSQQMSQSQIEQKKQEADTVFDLYNDIGMIRMQTANFSSVIQSQNKVRDEQSSVYKSLKSTQQQQQEQSKEFEEQENIDTKKDQQIQRLNKLLKQMAENRRSRLPTVVNRKPSAAGSRPSQIRATQFTNRFSTINFKMPDSFDFLGYSGKKKSQTDQQAIEKSFQQKASNKLMLSGCPQLIRKHLFEKENQTEAFQKSPLIFTSYGQILNSSLKVEHEVIIVMTWSKIYYFQKKKQKFIRSQSISRKSSLIVISKLSQAMVVLAHWGNQPDKELHLVIQTPYRTQFIVYFSQLFEKQWKKRLLVSYQNQLKYRLNSPGKNQKQWTVNFDNAKLAKFHFLNALQKGFLEIYRKKKLFKSAKWKQHFCVLSNVGILKFQSSTSAEDNLSLIPTIDYPIEEEKKGFEGKKFVFSIASSGQKLYFACKTQEDQQNWLNSFKKLQRDYNNMKNKFTSPTRKK